MGILGLGEREVITFYNFFKNEYQNLIFKTSVTGHRYIQYAFGFEIF